MKIYLLLILFLLSACQADIGNSAAETFKKRQSMYYEIHAADVSATRVNIKSPQGAKYIFPEGGNERLVYWRKDMNSDGKLDLLVDLGACGTGGCLYGVFLKVQEHNFKLAFFDYLKNPEFKKDRKGNYFLQSSEEFGYHSAKVQYSNFKLDKSTSFFKLDSSFILDNSHISEEKYVRDTIIDSLRFQLSSTNVGVEKHTNCSLVKIKNQRTGKIIQVIETSNFWFNQNMSFDYEDVNFDGYKDLTFFTGFNGSYGSMTFDYYLFDSVQSMFVFNRALTDLHAASVAIEFKKHKKQVISYEKSGCCWHRSSTFEFKNGKLKLVKRVTEEMDQRDRVIKNTEVFH